MADLIICNAAELLTLDGEGLGVIKNAWMTVLNGYISSVGDKESVLATLDKNVLEKAQRVDATGKVVLPGFVDCHTHLVFGGDRLEEDAWRLSNLDLKSKPYLSGMQCSVDRTRSASTQELFQQSEARLKLMIASGSTTIECKSGYGLNLDTELRQLKVVKELASKYNVDLVSTFLGAHGWPSNEMSKESYLDILTQEMIPAVVEKKLATFCDIWVDEGFFTAKDAEKVLSAGLDYGLIPKIHAEAYSYVGASDVAAELKAASSDHLNYTPVKTLKALSQAGVIGVLAPCTDYVVRHPVPASPEPMLENGLQIAVATNCNPGCYCSVMPFALQIVTRLNKLSIKDAIRGATINGAKALRLTDRGQLTRNYLADFQIWNVPRHEEIFYRLGENVIEMVFKKGEKIFENKPLLINSGIN